MRNLSVTIGVLHCCHPMKVESSMETFANPVVSFETHGVTI